LSSLKAIIVDDAAPIRLELAHLLNEFPEIDVIGEAGNVDDAIRLIEEKDPDVVFLDIQLKGETGFNLLEKVNLHSEVIFITAYDSYAIRAFEVNALDYLLKPIKKDRLSKTINRLTSGEIEHKRKIPQGRVQYDDVIYCMIDGSLVFIKVALLKCIVAAGKYSFAYYRENRRELVTRTLLGWQAILPEKYFVRIHRSTIINYEFVVKIHKCKNYTHEVYLKGIEKPFTMSRRYAVKLKERLSW